jgi:NAD(P)-dependent dehydrogenase (short-subunit alcohol dehydrogenase family)
MKIAITGHTKGIGASIASIFEKHGHQVVGFSRSNGYDISNPADRIRIINESADCDIFFNNAYSDFAQCDLLFELWLRWEQQRKTIVNITSSITMRWQHNFRMIKYRSAKAALEESSDFLWNKSNWPAVMVATPCLTATPMTAPRNDTNKVDPNRFAEMVFHALSQPDFRVQVLQLAVNPVE